MTVYSFTYLLCALRPLLAGLVLLASLVIFAGLVSQPDTLAMWFKNAFDLSGRPIVSNALKYTIRCAVGAVSNMSENLPSHLFNTGSTFTYLFVLPLKCVRTLDYFHS